MQRRRRLRHGQKAHSNARKGGMLSPACKQERKRCFAPARSYIALTMLSVIFLASPSNIMVLSR